LMRESEKRFARSASDQAEILKKIKEKMQAGKSAELRELAQVGDLGDLIRACRQK